jgi:excisionase family DNA binding protein
VCYFQPLRTIQLPISWGSLLCHHYCVKNMMRDIPSELLIATEVARWLRCAPSTIYAWAATGKIPSVKLNGTIRFLRADIERWMKDRSSDLDNSRPAMPHPIIPPTPTAVSYQTIKQAGARAIRSVPGKPLSPQHPKESPHSAVADGERKNKA